MDELQTFGKLPDSYAECMAAGIQAAETGQRSLARRLFRRAAEMDPNQKDAWLWLGGLARDPKETIEYLQKALAIDSHDEAAQEGMRWATEKLARQPAAVRETPAPSAPPPAAPAPTREAAPLRIPPWVWVVGILALALVVCLILFGPAAYEWVVASGRPTSTPTPTNLERIAQWRGPLEDAWQQGDWTVVITILERVRSLEPDYGGVSDWLTAAYTNYGRSLVDQERWEQARKAFDEALRIQSAYLPARTQVQALDQYLIGLERTDVGDWQGARLALQAVYELDHNYPNLLDLLYTACYRHGLQLQTSGDLKNAKAAYEAALRAAPEAQEAQAKLAEVNYLLTPPTPTPTPIPPKKIMVDVSEQRMYVYEGNRLIYKWVCSTGEPGRDTRTGIFSVQSRIPEAYSSVWRLRMPYWLGIYWAGGSENGIHALPINANGTTLWAGYLGRKVSFGCIILDTPNAKTLYNWAEIGTPVIVQP